MCVCVRVCVCVLCVCTCVSMCVTVMEPHMAGFSHIFHMSVQGALVYSVAKELKTNHVNTSLAVGTPAIFKANHLKTCKSEMSLLRK